jgi:hypothetical protein
MRFTIAQMLRLIVFVAVALTLAVSTRRDPLASRYPVVAVPEFLFLLCLAWGLTCLILLRQESRRQWSLTWFLVACLIALALLVGLVASAIRDQLSGTRRDLDIFVWFALVLCSPVCMVLAYACLRIGRTLVEERRRKPRPPV